MWLQKEGLLSTLIGNDEGFFFINFKFLLKGLVTSDGLLNPLRKKILANSSVMLFENLLQ